LQAAEIKQGFVDIEEYAAHAVTLPRTDGTGDKPGGSARAPDEQDRA
jgi:hypothetical protein